jgi:hypothetical protein
MRVPTGLVDLAPEKKSERRMIAPKSAMDAAAMTS